MSTKRIILFSFLVLVLAAMVIGYRMWNKPHRDVKDADAVKVTAADLYNAFIADSAKARLLYTGKVLDVSGEVSKISVNQQSQQLIFIQTPVPGAYINCTMEEKADGIKEGSTVSIKAICSGYIAGDADMGLPGDVFLTRGYSLNK